MPSPAPDVLRLLHRQHGAIATWQLTLLGVGGTSVTSLVRQLDCRTVFPGVHVLPGPMTTERMVLAALLAMSPRSSLRSAASLVDLGWDRVDAAAEIGVSRGAATGLAGAALLGLVDQPPLRAHLVMPTDSHLVRPGVDVTRAEQGSWPTAMVRGIPVVEPWRIMWDLAWAGRHEPGTARLLHTIATRADRLRLYPVDALVGLVEEPVLRGLPRRTPRLLTEVVEELRPGFSHSDTEALARSIAMEVADGLGLVVEPRPYPVRSQGRIIAEADLAIVSIRLDSEIDGPHHRLPLQQASDRRRDGLMHHDRWAVDRYDVALIDESEHEFRKRWTRDLHRRLDELG